PGDPFDVVHTFTPAVASGSLVGTRNTTIFSPTAAISGNDFGTYSQLTAKTSNVFNGILIGLGGEASVDASTTANVNSLIATSGIAINNSATSLVASGTGVSGQALAQNGSMTNANGVL